MEKSYCPRCIEDWEDDDGKKHNGVKRVSVCPDCGVCKNCEHLSDCGEAHTGQHCYFDGSPYCKDCEDFMNTQ